MNRLELMNKLYKMKDGEEKILRDAHGIAQVVITKGDWHLDNGTTKATNQGYEGEFWIKVVEGFGPGCWFTNAVNASDYFSDQQLKNIKW